MRKSHLCLTAAICCGLVAPALGQFTNVQAPPANELNHARIMEGIYGSQANAEANVNITFVLDANGVDYRSNALGISAYRIADSGGSESLNLANPSANADDSVWSDGIVRTRATARYAGFSQAFGYESGASGDGSNFVPLLSAQGQGFLDPNVSSHNASTTIAGDFRWMRTGNNGPHFSNPSDNADGQDHMVTYRIVYDSDPDLVVFLLFWEDKNLGQNGADWDFNDLVIELTVIPLPAPVLMAGFGLLAVPVLRRRMKKA